MTDDYENGYQKGYEAGRNTIIQEGFDLHSIRDTNPIVRILWGFKLIVTGAAFLVGLGLLIYFSILALSGPNIFRGVFD